MGVQIPDQCKPRTCNIYSSSPADPDSQSIRTSDSSSARQCLELECEIDHSISTVSTSVYSSDYELLYQQIEGLQRPQSKPKRKSHRSGSSKGKSGENVREGCQACNCAVSFAADCAAICCCPCALLDLIVLAFVRVPSAIARKAFCYAKKKAQSKKKNDENGEDHKREKRRYNTPPVSPQTSSPLERSLTPKLDTDKLWSDLYAAGHMGFGGALV